MSEGSKELKGKNTIIKGIEHDRKVREGVFETFGQEVKELSRDSEDPWEQHMQRPWGKAVLGVLWDW